MLSSLVGSRISAGVLVPEPVAGVAGVTEERGVCQRIAFSRQERINRTHFDSSEGSVHILYAQKTSLWYF